MSNISVLGAGTWGVVIANLLVENGHSVKVFARNKMDVENLNKTKIHKNLPCIKLNEKNYFTNEINDALNGAETIIYAIPSVAFREMVKKSIDYINEKTILISLTKGMEKDTIFTMSEVLIDELKKHSIVNDNIISLSGPTHAEEVGRKFPTTIVSASKNIDAAKYVQDIFMNEYFRVYTNTDIKGVEVCSAFKNVIAIASGMIVGVGFGDNLKAALITRGLVEMIRVGEEFGCKVETFYGLAGIGDMIVTSCSEHSRNYRFGKLLGEGYKTCTALEKIGMVVEGYNFLTTAIEIRDKYKLDLPITTGINKVINENEDTKFVIKSLMMRDKKSE